MAIKDTTPYLLFVVTVILLGPFQYGYHNGELNTPQNVISKCETVHSELGGLPVCIPMSDSQYALVVSVLTAGGLIGALSGSHFNDTHGRRLTLFGCNGLLGLGSLITAVASSANIMMVGRFIAGLGCGAVTVIVPVYISECVPKSNRGFFGALNQLSIVIGIMAAQIIGLHWSTLTQWRYIIGLGLFLSIIQLCLLPFCEDSPRYLASLPGGFNRAKKSLLRLRGTSVEVVEDEINEWRKEWANHAQSQNNNSEDEETNAGREHGDNTALIVEPVETHNKHVSIARFLREPVYRRPLCLILLLQIAQQLSGINAVIFFSTSIMSSVFPESSGKITVYISIVNLIMTVLSAGLMDKLGRRTLFLTSTVLMAWMAVMLGWSIENEYNKVSALSIVGFVAAFAIGLGPIPFLMIPELVDTPAVSSACSVGLSVNMIVNFLITVAFLELRNLIGNGSVFYLFAVSLTTLTVIALSILPETKGRSAEEVIRSGYSIHKSSYEPIHIVDDE
ncbi:general substrate transporter [Pilobolus umbonatus]|nr:general substrate transporter [Pilobolus umbonatus]